MLQKIKCHAKCRVKCFHVACKKNLQVLFRRQKLICRGCSSRTTGRLLLAGLWLQPDWTNILGNSDEYQLQFEQIHLVIQTNTFCSLTMQVCSRLLLAGLWLQPDWTNILGNSDKYYLQFEQIYLIIQTNTFVSFTMQVCSRLLLAGLWLPAGCRKTFKLWKLKENSL